MQRGRAKLSINQVEMQLLGPGPTPHKAGARRSGPLRWVWADQLPTVKGMLAVLEFPLASVALTMRVWEPFASLVESKARL